MWILRARRRAVMQRGEIMMFSMKAVMVSLPKKKVRENMRTALLLKQYELNQSVGLLCRLRETAFCTTAITRVNFQERKCQMPGTSQSPW
mmetsp:Transcript_55856/g.167407  ORF Transcript_55856/g.167407 Transcript_55856/m.167407 type:complete len:90 (+) Transcript_55856:3139-3408(+)